MLFRNCQCKLSGLWRRRWCQIGDDGMSDGTRHKGTYGLILILEYIFAIWLAITQPNFFNHLLLPCSKCSWNFPAFSSLHFEILPSGIGGGAMAEVHRVFVGSRQGVGVPCLHSTTSTTLWKAHNHKLPVQCTFTVYTTTNTTQHNFQHSFLKSTPRWIVCSTAVHTALYTLYTLCRLMHCCTA